MSVPLKARAFVLVTIAGGLALTALAAVRVVDTSRATLALLVLGAIATELFQVEADSASPDPVDWQPFSFSSGVHLAAVLVLGPWAGGLVAASGVVVVDGLRRAPARRVAFNASVFALAAVAGGYVFQSVGGTPGALHLPSGFLPVAALWLTYATVNTVFVSLVVSLDSGLALRPLLRDKIFAEMPSAAAEAGLGVSLAFFALTEPWAIVALAPLIVAVYQGLARHALQRRETARALETFANVVDERDAYTANHSERVAEYVRELAEALGLSGSDVARLRWAGRLHDLGKIAVDAAVLRKPSRLSEGEWASMRRHPRLSARLLRRFRFAGGAARAVEYHHERFDGNGYYRIATEAIPLAAHFLTVADSYDAMTTDRPYRLALTAEAALAEIEAGAGTQYHPAVARAFVAVRRGLDPAGVLTAEEHAELRQVWQRSRLPVLRVAAVSRHAPEALALTGVAGALGGVGAGVAALALAGLALGLGGLGWRLVDSRRLRRLARSLVVTLAADLPRDYLFHAVVNRIEADADVRWAGLIAWNDGELAGAVEIARGEQVFAGLGETGLTSWLLRELDVAPGELIQTDGRELGSDGVFVAAPLIAGGAVRGFLALGFGRTVPRHVELALRARLGDLSERLLSGAPVEQLPLRVAAAG
jgi:putative nucleotidyltransferase with HDIG domain